MPENLIGRTSSEWLDLGNKWFKAKDFQRAIEAYEKVVELDP